MVERRHGSGTFVAPPKIHFNKLMSYTEQMASRGLSGGSRIVSSGVLDNEQEITARLSLPSTTHLSVLERVRQAADEPFALETSYLSADEFPGLVTAVQERRLMLSTLEQTYEMNWPTPMKKSMPRPRILARQNCCPSRAAHHCLEFAR